MVRFQSIIQDRHHNALAGDSLAPRRHDVHVVPISPVLIEIEIRKKGRKKMIWMCRESVLHLFAAARKLNDYRDVLSHKITYITCTFQFLSLTHSRSVLGKAVGVERKKIFSSHRFFFLFGRSAEPTMTGRGGEKKIHHFLDKWINWRVQI